MMSRAQRVVVPPELVGFGGSQRAMTFELRHVGADGCDALKWARATFEGAPGPIRCALLAGFRSVLGLRLDRSDPDTVLGWHCAPISRPALGDTVVLDAASRLIIGYNIVSVSADALTWTTLVHYRNRLARPVWRTVEVVHLFLLPRLLTHAARRLT